METLCTSIWAVVLQCIHAVHAQSLCIPMGCRLPGFSPWDSPGQNTGVGCHALPQGIFPTQGLISLLCLLSDFGDRRVLCIAGRFITTEPPGSYSVYSFHNLLLILFTWLQLLYINMPQYECSFTQLCPTLRTTFAALWAIDHQAPLSMEFSKEEY